MFFWSGGSDPWEITAADIACTLGVMHANPSDAALALPFVREAWTGPILAYLEQGWLEPPPWQFLELRPDELAMALAQHDRRFKVAGVRKPKRLFHWTSRGLSRHFGYRKVSERAVMRLRSEQAMRIRELVREVAGEDAEVYLFGSRLDDAARGGDVDLLVVVPEPVERPALLAARLSARISRALDGRKVDILLDAPNLKRLPIHEIARSEGRRL